MNASALTEMPTRIPDATLEEITPRKAAAYLLLNHENNRTKKPGVVEMLAAQMKAGEWMVTHQGIAFDLEGKLIDGAHRLNAIVASGITVAIMVTRGVENASRIDMGIGRNMNDRFALGGNRRTVAYTSIVRGMFSFDAHHLKRITPGQWDRIECTYRKQIEFMENIYKTSTGKRGVLVGCSLGPGARALIYHPSSDVEEFYEVLCTGVMRDLSKSAPSTLRTFLTGKGPFSRQEIYRKTESALQAFFEGRALNKIYSAKQELFALPEPGSWK